jgi:peptidyl-prolyl cis-trans isomerase C
MKSGVKLAFFASIVILLGVSGCGKKDPVVARIGNRETVKLSELQTEVDRYSMFERSDASAIEKYRKALNGIVDRKIKLTAAYRLKMDKDTSIQKIIRPEFQRAMLQRMYETEIMAPIVSEKDIRDYYAKTARQVLIRDIFFRFPVPATPAQEDSVRAKAADVAGRIRKGEAYSEMARQYSQDEKTAFNGGLMGIVQYTRSDDPVLNAVFSMKTGDISQPVKNKSGYHILKVEEVQKKDRMPFEKAHDQIRGQLERERKSQLADREKQYVDRLRKRSGFTWVDAGVDSLVAHYRNSRQFFREDLIDSLKKLPESVRRQELTRFNDKKKTITTESIILHLEKSGFINGVSLGSREALMNTIDHWVITDLLIETAEKNGLGHAAEVRERTKRLVERLMVDSLNARVIWGSIRPDSAAVSAHYETFKDSLYSEPARIQVQEVVVADRNTADRIAAQTAGRWDLRMFPSQFTLRPGMKPRNGVYDMRPISQFGEVAPLLEHAKRGQTVGPVELKNHQFCLMKVLAREEKKARPFQMAQNRVHQDIIRSIRKEKEKAWLDEQKKSIRVSIDEKILQQAANAK